MSDFTEIIASSTSSRPDTSICDHLRPLISPNAGSGSDPVVKTEPIDPISSNADAGNGSDVLDERERHLQRYIQVVSWGARDEGVKRRKISPPECHSCSSPLSKPFACLTCPFIGCMPLHASSSSNSSAQCFNQHWSSSGDKCSFAIDPSSGAVYCSACQDLVYSDTLEDVFRLTRIRVEEESDSSREQSSIGRGRERGPWNAWKAPPEYAAAPKAQCGGLRPLLNLSQTCFLSAILQAFIHNPLLKAYFLSDKHNRHVCPNGTPGGLGIGKPYIGADGVPSPDREKGCMCCEMDRAFEEFHNHDKAPFGPITMLYAMWHASAELEGYGQQDAHSFFLAALDQIHAHAKGQLSSCNCIAHQTFSGALSSAVTCSNCGTTSTTTDPILDIQLDFPTSVPEGESLTLTSMLRRFCAEEHVGSHGRGYECSSCGGGQGTVAVRKLSVKKLPPVLSFQLKRFAHDATSHKIELPVRFPSHLNMLPFVEPDMTDSKSDASQSGGAVELPASLYDYDLFAVVTHEGKLDNGHYWADVLSGDEWWHCDDDKVTPTTIKRVQGQNAYMLFYVKRSLAYALPHSKLMAAAPNGVTSSQNTVQAAGKYPQKSGNSHVAGKNVAGKNPMGGRTGHPIVGMAV